MRKDTTNIPEKIKEINRKSLSRKIILYYILEIVLVLSFIFQIGKLTIKDYIIYIAFILITGFAIYHFSKKKIKLYGNENNFDDSDEDIDFDGIDDDDDTDDTDEIDDIENTKIDECIESEKEDNNIVNYKRRRVVKDFNL